MFSPQTMCRRFFCDYHVIFYSLVGLKGSKFKINELVFDVYVRDVGKTESTKLVCDPEFIKKRSQVQKVTIVEEELKTDFQSEKYVLTSIKGGVKWKTTTRKSTKAETLKLKLFKREDEFTNSEITLAEIKPIKGDVSSGDFT